MSIGMYIDIHVRLTSPSLPSRTVLPSTLSAHCWHPWHRYVCRSYRRAVVRPVTMPPLQLIAQLQHRRTSTLMSTHISVHTSMYTSIRISNSRVSTCPYIMSMRTHAHTDVFPHGYDTSVLTDIHTHIYTGLYFRLCMCLYTCILIFLCAYSFTWQYTCQCTSQCIHVNAYMCQHRCVSTDVNIDV